MGREVPTEINPQLMHDIQVLVSRLVGKAHQLIKNFTTNLAENWMQIRCKFDGGKVINRSQSGSWEHCCSGAGLQKNLGKCCGPLTWEKMTGFPASQVFVDTAESSAKKADKDRKRKATEEAKDSQRRSKYSRNDNSIAARKAYSHHDYGIEPDDKINDVSPEYLEEMKTSFFNTRVTVTKEKSDDIERDTRQQRDSELWMIERTKRITASRVGGIVKMKKKIPREVERWKSSYSVNFEEMRLQDTVQTWRRQQGGST